MTALCRRRASWATCCSHYSRFTRQLAIHWLLLLSYWPSSPSTSAASRPCWISNLVPVPHGSELSSGTTLCSRRATSVLFRRRFSVRAASFNSSSSKLSLPCQLRVRMVRPMSPRRTPSSCLISAAFLHPGTWSRTSVSAKHRGELYNSPAIDLDPKRWPGEYATTRAKADDDDGVPVHLPFGQGPRECVGRAFAQFDMTAAVMTILRSTR